MSWDFKKNKTLEKIWRITYTIMILIVIVLMNAWLIIWRSRIISKMEENKPRRKNKICFRGYPSSFYKMNYISESDISIERLRCERNLYRGLNRDVFISKIESNSNRIYIAKDKRPDVNKTQTICDGKRNNEINNISSLNIILDEESENKIWEISNVDTSCEYNEINPPFRSENKAKLIPVECK